MAARKKYDLAVVTGTYTDNSGAQKNRYQNVGAVMEKEDGGTFIMLERWFNPAGVPNPDNRSNLLLSMFPPKDQQQQQQSGHVGGSRGRTHNPPPSGEDSDIPF